MSNRYHLSQIIKYEKISRDYIRKEQLDDDLPDPEMLLDLASQQKEFNAGFAQYVIDRHLQSVADYIYEVKKIDISLELPFLKRDILNNNLNEEAYEKWLTECKEDNFCSNYQETVDAILKHNFINMLFYFFYSEEKMLNERFNEYFNKKNERKFYILQ